MPTQRQLMCTWILLLLLMLLLLPLPLLVLLHRHLPVAVGSHSVLVLRQAQWCVCIFAAVIFLSILILGFRACFNPVLARIKIDLMKTVYSCAPLCNYLRELLPSLLGVHSWAIF